MSVTENGRRRFEELNSLGPITEIEAAWTSGDRYDIAHYGSELNPPSALPPEAIRAFEHLLPGPVGPAELRRTLDKS